ncbi:MAG: ATP-binding protein [Coprobacillus sp.]|nr:ATP-binding protein [Coprobacillus sp.]
MEIKRDDYLNLLIREKDKPLVKIITGIRRCGKSYLLFNLYRDYLLSVGVKEKNIITLNLDERENIVYHEPENLENYIKGKIKSTNERYYVFIDEAQYAIIKGEKKDENYNEFYFVINGLIHLGNVDVYLTGSNSRFLSKDIRTEFRGRYIEIGLNPLSFSEFYLFKKDNGKSISELFNEYLTFGGLPQVVLEDDIDLKRKMLKDIFSLVYYKDIIERYRVDRKDVLDDLMDILSTSVGGLTNPNKIYNTYLSKTKDKSISLNTINAYLSYLEDSFLVENITRYDVVGRKGLNSLSKYYFSDIGIRNARLNFNRLDINNIMENIIANEMISRGYDINVGVVPVRSHDSVTNLEIDLVCRKGPDLYYLQISQTILDQETKNREIRPLLKTGDGFTKFIICYDETPTYRSEEGIIIINIRDFLLEKNLKNL